MHDVLPVIFFGHGNPMNAVQHNGYTEGWRAIGTQLRKPRWPTVRESGWRHERLPMMGQGPRQDGRIPERSARHGRHYGSGSERRRLRYSSM